METKVREVQALVQESWLRFERHPEDSALIQPVKKGGQTEKAKVSTEQRSRSGEQTKTGQKSEARQESGVLEEMADEIQQYLEDVNVQLTFEIHEETGEPVIQVVNQGTGEVIRQIPPEDMIQLREKLAELQGVLFSDKV